MQSLPVALIGLFASLLAVEGAQLQRPAGECLDNSFASSNTFPSPFRVIAAPQTGGTAVNTTVKFAQGFEVTYFPTYKLVTNLIAYGGPFSYALYQCGMQPPAASLLPNNTKIFSIPLSSIAVEDTTMLSIVEILGLQARVSYVTEYAVNPCMQSLGLSGCGRLTSGAANGYTDLNATQVGDLDGILGYQATPKTIAVTASADPGPLNRAEWIKFVATFFNREDVANALFDQIAQHYNSIKSAVAGQAFMGARKPVVAWVLYNPAGYGAPDQIQISFATYKINYTVDAGGAMLDLAAANATALKYGTWGKEVSYQYNSLILAYNNTNLAQQLREILADVDVMIEESRFTTPEMSNANLTMASLMSFYGFTAADQQNLKFLKNSMVVRQDVQSNPAGFTDWLEMAIVQPDVVLRDLTSLVTPAAITTNDPPRFLRRLGVVTPTVLQSSQCPLKNCLLSSAPGYINDPICPLVYRDCSGNIVAATPQQRCAPVCNSPGVSGPALAPPPMAASINTPTLASLALACLLALLVAVAM